MKVELKDGATMDCHVSNCTGYAASEITLYPKDAAYLMELGWNSSTFRQEMMQLLGRLNRIGNDTSETMEEKFFVVWKAYGEWKQTSYLFASKKDAERHVKMYISEPGKDYNTNVEVRSIFVPR